MRKGLFFWKLFLGNATLVGVVLATCVALILAQFERFHEKELTQYLSAQATTLRICVRDRFDATHAAMLDKLAKEIGSQKAEGIRITFVARNGTVYGDSQANPAKMESHADRPEVIQALATGVGQSVRWSHTISQELKYTAVRVGSREAPVGVVRVAMPIRMIGARTQSARTLMWSIGLIALLAAVFLALGLARLWSRRIGLITETARDLSRGELSARVDVAGSDEVAELARSLHQMRDHLVGQLATIAQQHRTLESLVDQLHEGVVVVGEDGRIVLTNTEAVRMLNREPYREAGQLIGLPFEWCIPHFELQQLLRFSDREKIGELPSDSKDQREGAHPQPSHDVRECKLRMGGADGTVWLRARAFDIVLPPQREEERSGQGGERRGRLLVLTDVTELTQSILMKADFAANASHELRTPLAVIRAAAETLRSVDPVQEKESLSHFLDVVDRQSGRMENMVADLLDLSRVESPTTPFRPSVISSKEFLEEIRRLFSEALEKKKIHWTVEVLSGGERIVASVDLLRIVLRNLVDNAVRFTAEGGHISIRVSALQATYEIEVSDDGCGIPREDQDRVFERFYQVQRARSGPERGTGLGLSIVRHAVAAMGGAATLASDVDKGTRVRVTIPRVG